MQATQIWRRLDNAAKFFPPTSTKRDPHVFRIACEVTEPVDPASLQVALDDALQQMPYFRSTLKKGFFWYYLEEGNERMPVQPDTLPPCSAILNGDSQEPLIRLTYYRCRINLEVFHALSDGTGAFIFFCGLVQRYLVIKYGEAAGPVENERIPLAARQQDDFEVNYSPKNRRRGVHNERAYRIRGDKLPGHQLNIIVGRMPVKAVLARAKQAGATLSEYLITTLIAAIGQGMPLRKRSKPISVSVPVDLRRFYASHTVRNFFSNFGASHRLDPDGGAFEDILASVQKSFKQHVTSESLDKQMNQFAALEHNAVARVVPLFIKIPVLSISGMVSSKGDSAGFSNLGVIHMPKTAMQYIRVFDVMLSTTRPQLCVCTFGDTLSIGFSSPYVSTEVQCAFFRALAAQGIRVEIYPNIPERWEYENL